MNGTHCFTSISLSYLAQARVLAETVRRHHPDWTLWLCVSDCAPDGFDLDPKQEAFDRVLWLGDLPIEGRPSWVFCHNVVELCTAVKGMVLEHILAAGADAVVYIDPDIALFNPLVDVAAALEHASIVLTPHLVDPETERAAVWENERSALLHGVYNLGFLAVRNTAEGRRFAAWWRERLVMLCYEDAPRGIYTDQRWCDLVPAFFEDVRVLRDPGYNVASWNLGKRPLRFDRDGQIRIGDALLRFYHFTKIDSAGSAMVERYASGSPAVFELVAWYRAARDRHRPEAIPPRWWAFGRYSDGTPITQADRELYRSRPELAVRFPEPFEAETYLAWLRAEGHRAG